MEEKPWRIEQLKSLEDELPARQPLVWAATGFTPRVPSDHPKETRDQVVKFLETVEQRGRVNSKFARLCFS